VLLLMAYVLLGLIYSLVAPLLEAPDEVYHYAMVKRLADGHGLPVQTPGEVGLWRQEGNQPPLYYALAALVTRGIHTDDLGSLLRMNPHADVGVVKRDRNANTLIHAPDRPLLGETPLPFRGAVLAIYLSRWLSLLFGAGSVLATYLLAREVVPEDRRLALSVTCLTAFNAMFLFITSSVNNDALVTVLSAVSLWLMVRYVARRPRASQWALLAVLLGLAALAKLSALGLLPLAALTLCVVGWRHRSWRDLIVGGAFIGLAFAALNGWWFLRNWLLYGDPTGLSAFVPLIGARYPPSTLRQLWGERQGFAMSFWGLFGSMNVPAPSWVYTLLSTFAALGFLGLPLALWRWQRSGRWTAARRWQMALVAAWPVILMVSLIRWTLMTPASQGRLLFPGLSAVSLLIALGLQAWLPSRYRLLLPSAMGAAMLASAAMLPFTAIRPVYAAPERLTRDDVRDLTERLDVVYGEKVRLLGYRLQQEEAAPGDDVILTLYWEALAAMDEDYSVFVHLLDEEEFIIGQRDVYPGQGTYPTSYWQPGEVIADIYVVRVSPTTLTPQTARFEAGLYRANTGERLAAQPSTASGQETSEIADDAVRFGRLALPLQRIEGGLQPVFFSLEGRIALVGYALDRRSAAPGEALHLTLRWRALRDIDVNYSVFTHVFSGDAIWAQKDAWPLEGDAPTALWSRGFTLDDTYELVLKPETPQGVYDLQVGMTDGDGRRLVLLDNLGHALDTRVLLGQVRVLAGQ